MTATNDRHFSLYRPQVGQAKSDSDESKSQVEKALNEVKVIMDELNSLRDIKVNDLDALGMCALGSSATQSLSSIIFVLCSLNLQRNGWPTPKSK